MLLLAVLQEKAQEGSQCVAEVLWGECVIELRWKHLDPKEYPKENECLMVQPLSCGSRAVLQVRYLKWRVDASGAISLAPSPAEWSQWKDVPMSKVEGK